MFKELLEKKPHVCANIIKKNYINACNVLYIELYYAVSFNCNFV